MGYTHGTRWSDNAIKTETFRVMNALDIKRMPTHSEIKNVTGNNRLANKISRTGGYKYWASELNLEIKDSETKFGNEWEYKIKSELENKGFDVLKMSTKHPYDLLINKNLKIDVKVSRYYKKEKYKYHTFNLEKEYHNCDIFICVGLNDNDEIEKLLIIPSKHLMGIKQLSVGVISKYDKFDRAYKYLDIYNKFYNEVI